MTSWLGIPLSEMSRSDLLKTIEAMNAAHKAELEFFRKARDRWVAIALADQRVDA